MGPAFERFRPHALSLVALTAQAMTAALAAGKRSMDWVGVCMLGCITALGGGTIRDVLLGHYPLVWVHYPSFLVLAAAAALVTILVARLVHRLNTAFLVLDAIGLVVLTMLGCDVAAQVDPALPLMIVVVAGMITGCAGGVLRDILCNDVPLLFRAELYASVVIVTGLFYRSGSAGAQSGVVDSADLCPRPVVSAAGDPLQVGNADIRLRREPVGPEAVLPAPRLRPGVPAGGGDRNAQKARARIARIAQSGVAARASRRFAGKPLDDTTRKPWPGAPARNCDLSTRGSNAEICGALSAESDIDWF